MLFCDGRLSSAEANLDFSLVGIDIYAQYHHAKHALAYTVYSSIGAYSKHSLKDFSYLSVKPKH